MCEVTKKLRGFVSYCQKDTPTAFVKTLVDELIQRPVKAPNDCVYWFDVMYDQDKASSSEVATWAHWTAINMAQADFVLYIPTAEYNTRVCASDSNEGNHTTNTIDSFFFAAIATYSVDVLVDIVGRQGWVCDGLRSCSQRSFDPRHSSGKLGTLSACLA